MTSSLKTWMVLVCLPSAPTSASLRDQSPAQNPASAHTCASLPDPWMLPHLLQAALMFRCGFHSPASPKLPSWGWNSQDGSPSPWPIVCVPGSLRLTMKETRGRLDLDLPTWGSPSFAGHPCSRGCSPHPGRLPLQTTRHLREGKRGWGGPGSILIRSSPLWLRAG